MALSIWVPAFAGMTIWEWVIVVLARLLFAPYMLANATGSFPERHLMITLPISTLFVCALTIWLLVLAVNVVRQRGVAKVSLGDGDDTVLQRRRSAHANFVENAPFMIALVALAEFQGANTLIVGATAAAFFVARLAHGYALSFTTNSPKLRPFGMTLTLICMIVMIVVNLSLFVL